MRNFGRILTLGVLGVAGCSDATFHLLPERGGPASQQSAGMSGTGGAAAYAGRAGAAGRGSGGSWGAAGSGRTGGMGGMNTAGGPDDMGPCSKTPATPYWSISRNTCVGCRYGDDCVGSSCDLDCASGQRCDGWTETCKLACDGLNGTTNPCPKSSVCDSSRFICVECDKRLGSQSGCAAGLVCSPGGACVECNTSDDCHDAKSLCLFPPGECVECYSFYDCGGAKPVCSFNECRPCFDDNECNPGGYNSGMPTKVCNGDGRCVDPPL
jgi:hypothetical protein